MDWFPWYFQIYKADTMHLNPYQDGCYRRLIDHYMETRQALPDNDSALARIIGDSEANWLAMASPLVRPFFKQKNGRLYLKKCENELSYQDIKTKRLSESGKNGASKRWSKINDLDSHPIATLKPLDSTGQDTTIQDSKKRKKEEAQAPLPEWVPIDAWNGFLEMRKNIKKPLTERAIKLTISELQKLNADGHDPAAVLDQSTQRNWSGVFPLKEQSRGLFDNNQSGNTSRNSAPSKSDRAKAALRRGLEE